jgi:hypothetical protein
MTSPSGGVKPAEWRERYAIRRYGFHGLPHAWCARQVAERTRSRRIVTAHLGEGGELLQLGSEGRGDHHGIGEPRAAVLHPVPDGVRRGPVPDLPEVLAAVLDLVPGPQQSQREPDLPRRPRPRRPRPPGTVARGSATMSASRPDIRAPSAPGVTGRRRPPLGDDHAVLPEEDDPGHHQ